jgi:hypothetical protein
MFLFRAFDMYVIKVLGGHPKGKHQKSIPSLLRGKLIHLCVKVITEVLLHRCSTLKYSSSLRR